MYLLFMHRAAGRSHGHVQCMHCSGPARAHVCYYILSGWTSVQHHCWLSAFPRLGWSRLKSLLALSLSSAVEFKATPSTRVQTAPESSSGGLEPLLELKGPSRTPRTLLPASHSRDTAILFCVSVPAHSMPHIQHILLAYLRVHRMTRQHQSVRKTCFRLKKQLSLEVANHFFRAGAAQMRNVIDRGYASQSRNWREKGRPSFKTGSAAPDSVACASQRVARTRAPVLSVQMVVAQPMVSAAARLRTRLLSASMRFTLYASAIVTASGKPSGMATTCGFGNSPSFIVILSASERLQDQAAVQTECPPFQHATNQPCGLC